MRARHNRFALLCMAIALAVACVTAAKVDARPASPAPDGAASDCGWSEDGTSWTDSDGTVYTCHCARLKGPNGLEVICRWYSDGALPARKSRRPIKHKPVPKKKPAARYGISTGVIA